MDIQHITALLLQYKYLIMLGLMFLEGPVLAFLCAFLAAQGHFNFGIVYLISMAGDIIPDSLRYRIGRLGRSIGAEPIAIIDKERNMVSRTLLGRFAPMYNRVSLQIQKLEKKAFLKRIDHNARHRFFLSLFVIKVTPPLSVAGHFSFGFLKIPYRKFLLLSAFITFLFESVFLNLGYFSGISVSAFQSKVDIITTIISSVAIGLIALSIGFYIVKRFRHFSKRLDNPIIKKTL